MITMKTDLNSNDCQWKHMGKSITDHIKPVFANSSSKNISEMSIDEITEFSVYDATSRQVRREALSKKLRRVHINSNITVKLAFKNQLGMNMQMQNIRLKCRYLEGEGEFIQLPVSIDIAPTKISEVMIKVTPTACGQIEIYAIQWELFDVIVCSKEIQGRQIGLNEDTLKF
jgi:hypothetical protein